MLYIKESKKDNLLSVKRLKLKRERHVEQGEKDYARTGTLFLTDDADTKNRKVKERKSIRTTSFHLLSSSFFSSLCICVCV